MHDLDLLISDLYKDHAAKLLAVLTRLFGAHNLELAEDVLQEAFSKALNHWQEQGIPDKPSAWLMQTAKNQAIDVIRANKTKLSFSTELAIFLESEWSLGNTVEQEFEPQRIKDDQLRMIFMCCHASIKPENRIPFILKTLCSFSLNAIARALLLPEETVKKRLLRTRKQLQAHNFTLPEDDKLPEAMDTVHTVLYLLFNEGFHSSNKKRAINISFCQEAIALLRLLIDEPRIVNQDTCGLMALMHFHMARIDTKTDAKGFNIPIDLQERSRWQQSDILTAQQFLLLAESVSPGASGRFFIEAQIANQHCSAENFAATDWAAIITHYDHLITITGSPVAKLNQAIAMAYHGDISDAIKRVESLQYESILKKSHLPLATLAHLYAMASDKDKAYAYAQESMALGGTPIEQQFMLQQLERLLSGTLTQPTTKAT